FGAVASTIRSKFVVHKHIASSEHRTGRWLSLEGQVLHTNSNSDTVSVNSEPSDTRISSLANQPRSSSPLLGFYVAGTEWNRGVVDHNSNPSSRRGSSTSPILDPLRNDSMVSDSDAIVSIHEQDLDRPETGAHATPSLSMRQPPETQIRGWPELDCL